LDHIVVFKHLQWIKGDKLGALGEIPDHFMMCCGLAEVWVPPAGDICLDLKAGLVEHVGGDRKQGRFFPTILILVLEGWLGRRGKGREGRTEEGACGRLPLATSGRRSAVLALELFKDRRGYGGRYFKLGACTQNGVEI